MDDRSGDRGSGEPPAQPPEPGSSAVAQLRHALLNPLNQIIGYSELLQEELTEGGLERYVADLRRIETAGRLLLKLVREHLTTPTVPSSEVPIVAATTPRGDVVTPTGSGRADVMGHLLVVDDNQGNRELLARHLGQRGHRVETAASAEEALQRVADEQFDVVLLDVVMPVMGGLEVLADLRERHSMAALPVIMATARDTSEDVVAALRLGANDYVTKPLDPSAAGRPQPKSEFFAARKEFRQ